MTLSKKVISIFLCMSMVLTFALPVNASTAESSAASASTDETVQNDHEVHTTESTTEEITAEGITTEKKPEVALEKTETSEETTAKTTQQTTSAKTAVESTAVESIDFGEISSAKRNVAITFNRDDIESAALEYIVNDEFYSVKQTDKKGDTLSFELDCSLNGKYELALLHLTYKNGKTEDMEISGESFSVYSNPVTESMNTFNASSLRLGSSGKKVVVIDAGHDSTHAGATRDGIHEEKLVLEIAQATYNELKKYPNVEVYMTRNTEACPVGGGTNSSCLRYRSDFAKSKNADLFVSIHINSTAHTTQTSASGAYVYISNYSKYYANDKSLLLTKYILDEYSPRVGLPTHGAWTNADDHNNGKYDDGRWQDDLAVIRNNVLQNIEPILIEEAFINNPNDQKVLTDSSKRKAMAVANAAGIAKYLGLSASPLKVSGFNASVSGSKVSLSPVTTGSTTGYNYKYVYNKYNSATGSYDWKTWGVIKGMNTTPTATWTAPSSGSYELYMDVFDGSQTANFSKIISISAPTLTGVSAASSVNVGESIKITPTVSGNASGCNYKYVWNLNNNWSEWGVLKAFSPTTSVSYTPKKAGTYYFYVDMLDTNNKVSSKSTTTVVKANNIGYTSISISPSAPKVGSAITIAPNISNSSGVNFKYVWCQGNWTKWGVIKHFSSAKSATYTPKAPGTYVFYVDALSSNGQIQTQSATATVTLGWKPGDISFSSTSGKVGTPVKITGNATGSGHLYKYVWNLNNSWAKWGVIQGFSSSDTTTFVPTSSGSHTIYMDVLDTYGNVQTISKTFKVS